LFAAASHQARSLAVGLALAVATLALYQLT